MLFPAAILDKIKSGDVTLAFRYWRKPTVKAGGTLRTPAGVLGIEEVATCDTRDITQGDSRRAGFESRDDLLGSLDLSRGGTLHRIRFRFVGADPRVALGVRPPTPSELRDIEDAMARMDAGSPWTRRVLALIAGTEGISAARLAEATGTEKDALKRNIRKLKDLGLTESLPRGYRISPRGRAVLAHLDIRK